MKIQEQYNKITSRISENKNDVIALMAGDNGVDPDYVYGQDEGIDPLIGKENQYVDYKGEPMSDYEISKYL